MSSFYESDAALAQYLLFHYGTPGQICPLLPAARVACGFPVRCVTETLRGLDLPRRERALDLGCAVGRSSLELARTFTEVVGLDFSSSFIAAAQRMQTQRRIAVSVLREGTQNDEILLELSGDVPRDGVTFRQGDACALPPGLGMFDFVLMANLIDRLPDPAACLAQLPEVVRPGGWLVITSPYTWLEEYTPRKKWLDRGEGTLAALRESLAPAFDLHQTIDLPFLIREHRRKFQWSVAEAGIWRRA